MCTDHRELYGKRRAAFFEAMRARGNDAIAVLPAAPVFPRNNDVDHEYRQDSDLFYLTGFEEPESALVLAPPLPSTVETGAAETAGPADKALLFLRPRDPDREVWDGPRAGVDGAKVMFGMDQAFVIRELNDRLPKLFENRRRIFYRLGRDRAFDDIVLGAIDRTRARARFGVTWPTEIVDPGSIIHEMRMFKGKEDLASIRKATEITQEAHLRAMSACKPGMYEYEIEALLLETFRRRGSDRPAYGSIVGSGANATILHYRTNHRQMQAGDLLLIDAGCEYDYYASDVTRTFPVSGKFSREQQAIYELVLEAQLAGIERARKGVSLDDVHRTSVEVITAGLIRLGLLTGERDKLIEQEAYRPFYMHRTSHWLGMDVHDVGAYYIGGKPRPLEAGMVLTVEPGIYIAKDYDRVAPEWRGIGVRIEDDILVTEDGPANLTGHIPKSVADVERSCAA
jgi:Xaa-Pro aminopeptidase